MNRVHNIVLYLASKSNAVCKTIVYDKSMRVLDITYSIGHSSITSCSTWTYDELDSAAKRHLPNWDLSNMYMTQYDFHNCPNYPNIWDGVDVDNVIKGLI